MGYGYGYGRRGSFGSRHSAQVTAGRVAKPNKRPGNCRSCGEEIPAHAGHLYREKDGAWSVVHVPAEWAGSPVSGKWIGGCPADTDKLNGAEGSGAEADRIAQVAATAAAMAPAEPVSRGYRRTSYARLSSGAVAVSCDHIDYPCCGC